RHEYRARIGNRLWLAMTAVAMTGCATPPPPPEPTSLPQTGDTVEQIAARGYEVALVSALVADDHEYAYLVAHSTNSNFELVQVDGKTACGRTAALEPATQQQGSTDWQWLDLGSQPQPMTAARHWQEFTQWQWVAQPDGLRYLASQMRQACDLEADTEPQSLPSPWTRRVKDTPPPQSSSDDSVGEMLLHILIGVPVIVMAAPYVIAGETAALVVSAPFVAAEHSANTRQIEQRKQMHLGLTRADTESLLGKPEAEFTLDPAPTKVLMYEAGESPQNYFVGFENDAIVWIHAQDEWLEHLAKRARKEKS
ncbi:MAG TPA: hypothetical protein PL152_08025, partial [Steroidobacteraceae bacterium]|nr:hypothetical protein [Steroidobacteraceae bacterium]